MNSEPQALVDVVAVCVDQNVPQRNWKTRTVSLPVDLPFSDFKNVVSELLKVVPTRLYYTELDVELDLKDDGDLGYILQKQHVIQNRNSSADSFKVFVEPSLVDAYAAPIYPTSIIPTTTTTTSALFSPKQRKSNAARSLSPLSSARPASSGGSFSHRSSVSSLINSRPRSASSSRGVSLGGPRSPSPPLAPSSLSNPQRHSSMSMRPFGQAPGGRFPKAGRDFHGQAVHPKSLTTLYAFVIDDKEDHAPRRKSVTTEEDVSHGKKFSEETLERLMSFRKLRDAHREQKQRDALLQIEKSRKVKKLSPEEIKDSIERQFSAREISMNKIKAKEQQIYKTEKRVLKPEKIKEFVDRMDSANAKHKRELARKIAESSKRESKKFLNADMEKEFFQTYLYEEGMKRQEEKVKAAEQKLRETEDKMRPKRVLKADALEQSVQRLSQKK